MKRGLCGREPTACKSEVKEVNETRNGGRVFVHFVHFSLYAAVALFSSFPCQRLCVFSCGLIRASITIKPQEDTPQPGNQPLTVR